KQDRAVVVEGYFDAIALHTVGITHVVASLGTAFSQDQLKRLLRYTESKQVIFNFDADSAGTQATQRAMSEIESLIDSGQVQVRILTLPDGKDADEFLKSSSDAAEKYHQLLTNAPLWFDWQIQQILTGQNLKQADQFQQVAQNLVKLLNRIDHPDLRSHYIGHCANLLSQGDSRLIPLYAEKLQIQLKKPTTQRSAKSALIDLPISSERSILEEAEADLLRIYLHCPEYRQQIVDALEEKDLLFSMPSHRFLWQSIAELEHELRAGKNSEATATQQSENASNQLLSSLQDRSLNFGEQMTHLFHLTEKKQWEDILRAPLVIKGAIATLELVAWETYRRHCIQQWRQLDPAKESERMQYFYQEIQTAKQRIQELEKLRLAQI
ncbi:MAG: toprim domain-containing protein, partial [Microcystaceae cyanobacterium]